VRLRIAEEVSEVELCGWVPAVAAASASSLHSTAAGRGVEESTHAQLAERSAISCFGASATSWHTPAYKRHGIRRLRYPFFTALWCAILCMS
jgi:hypothetical protein